jgi:hypothetical protein
MKRHLLFKLEADIVQARDTHKDPIVVGGMFALRSYYVGIQLITYKPCKRHSGTELEIPYTSVCREVRHKASQLVEICYEQSDRRVL